MVSRLPPINKMKKEDNKDTNQDVDVRGLNISSEDSKPSTESDTDTNTSAEVAQELLYDSDLSAAKKASLFLQQMRYFVSVDFGITISDLGKHLSERYFRDYTDHSPGELVDTMMEAFALSFNVGPAEPGYDQFWHMRRAGDLVYFFNNLDNLIAEINKFKNQVGAAYTLRAWRGCGGRWRGPRPECHPDGRFHAATARKADHRR